MTLRAFAALPAPPTDAVIFSAQRTAGDDGYGRTAELRVAGVERAYGTPV